MAATVGAAVSSDGEVVRVVYAGDAVAWLQQADHVTTHSSMALSMVMVVGVGAAVRAVVDDGAAAVGAVVGVEDAGEVDEEGADDRVADARVLRVLHIPAFASSIICCRRSIIASSPAMAATDSVDPSWAIPKHQAANPHDLDEHGDQPTTTTTESDELRENFSKFHQIKQLSVENFRASTHALPRSMALVPNVTILEVTTGVHARRGEIGGAVSGEEQKRGEK